MDLLAILAGSISGKGMLDLSCNKIVIIFKDTVRQILFEQYLNLNLICTVGISPAHIFVADFPPAALRFHQRTRRVRLINLCTTDPKSSHKPKNREISGAHYYSRRTQE